MKYFFQKLCMVYLLSNLAACLGTDVGNGDKQPAANAANKGQEDNDKTPAQGAVTPTNVSGEDTKKLLIHGLFSPCTSIIQKGSDISFTLDDVQLSHDMGVYSLKYKNNLIATAAFENTDTTLTAYDTQGKVLAMIKTCSAILETVNGGDTVRNISIKNVASQIDLTWTINDSMSVTKIVLEEFNTSTIPAKRIQELVLD